MKAGDRYPSTVPDICERLADQWRKYQYAVTLEQANIILNQISQDKGLLEKCAQFKVAITEVIWAVAVASARRQLLKGLTASRQQAKDTLKKARRRALSETIAGDDHDEKRILVRGVRARYQIKTLTQTFARRKDILARYSNPPGKERGAPRSEPDGRREDIARNSLFTKLTTRLCKVSTEARNDLRCRILVATGFHQAGKIKNAKEDNSDASDTIEKHVYRLKRQALRTS